MLMQTNEMQSSEIQTNEFQVWLSERLENIENVLNSLLPTADQQPARLHQAMRYAVLGGGKRIRALLCYAAGEAAQAPLPALHVAAAALEMIHAYSLVHDDLPSMDNDDLRRGKATVHLQYDEATALLVGDALQTQAFITLSTIALPAFQQVALVRELALASGSLGMAGGQAIDLASVGIILSSTELETMHRLKTGALLQAAVRMGRLCGSNAGVVADEYDASLQQYACSIGLAFQVVDDILDATTGSAILGKTAGKDARHAKPTYVSMLGLDASRALAKELHTAAHAALAPLGPQGGRLAKLADLMVERAR